MTEAINKNLKSIDPEIFKIIGGELQRQEQHIELIASENYASQAVMQAQGSAMTNKYAEGYPGKRYYGGCEHVDEAEEVARERLKALYKADYANVQPHSGSQANAAVCLALLNPHDRILGMALPEGGHLTHGSKVNFSGRLYEAYAYGVDPHTGLIDFEQVRKQAHEVKPKLIIAGFSAYSRIIPWEKFRAIADEVGAYLLIDMAHVSGLVAAGLYPNPVPHADVVTSTTHKTLRGPRGGFIIARDNPEIHKKLNSAVFPGTQGGPLMHVIAAKAVAFKEALESSFIDYQKQVLANAHMMVTTITSRGYKIVSGGTDNHLFLIDLIGKDFTGQDADLALAKVNITVNRNTVPGDPRSPFITSGLRLGTPAVTTRGFKQEECHLLANWIADSLDRIHDERFFEELKANVENLCNAFPVYQWR